MGNLPRHHGCRHRRDLGRRLHLAKRYLRKRDRQYALASNLGHATESGRVVANDSAQGSIHVPAAGMFQPAPIEEAGVYSDKPKGKKNWLGRDRT